MIEEEISRQILPSPAKEYGTHYVLPAQGGKLIFERKTLMYKGPDGERVLIEYWANPRFEGEKPYA